MKYELDIAKSKKLEEAMKQIPDKSEKLVNESLHTKGAKQMTSAIVGFMPVSGRLKTHAKTSSSLKSTNFNLGFEIMPKAKFNYLVFPDEGRGRSNPVAQNFFKKGSEQAGDRILDDVMKALEEANQDL